MLRLSLLLSLLAPNGAPTSVSAQALGAMILEVTWSPPEVENRNGIISGYRLCVIGAGDPGPCHNQIDVSGADTVHAIAGLKPYTMYTVSIQARTIVGYGPTTVLHHRTGESSKYGP